MFFATYLRRELRRRMRQAIFVALGLAVGIGLVVTVSAASAGVKKADASVLSSLYGVGTDVTVTGEAPQPKKLPANGQAPKGATQISGGPNGAEICQNGKCENAAGKTISNLAPEYLPIKSTEVGDVARLHDVAAAAGGLLLTDNTITFPKNFGSSGGSAPPTPSTVNLEGVDTGHTRLGPLSNASLTSGHAFTAADSGSDVAVVDSGYATSNSLKVGSTITIDSVKFTVIGIVRQPEASSPPDVYIPLKVAQSLKTGPLGVETGDVNTIYVTATSAAAISTVQHEIARLLPHATVTTAASLANEVTGSLANAAKLVNDLGKWLAVVVLIAAFAVAGLLTMSAVARRVGEFGTLKAIGWRTRRIVLQVLGESVVMGVAGAAVGVGLGLAGAAIIAKVAPKLPALVPGTGGGGTFQSQSVNGGPVSRTIGGTPDRTIHVPLHPSITVNVIVLAVILAVAGGLLAGSLGSWRIAKLRPADALSRVA
ncbi:MAG TPA: ABC transporter permease [Streptosporangiaceae bacterium]|nr:ABC transporter permease [Streptosporangiaceae bacterium]